MEHLSFVNDSIESCTVCVTSGTRSLFVVAIYRPPSGSLHDFLNHLMFILGDSLLRNCETIVTGDLNINLIGYEESCVGTRNFVFSMHSMNFLPYITKPTRFPRGNQVGGPSLIDHVWYNKYDNAKSGILLFDHTDHLPTFFLLTSFVVDENCLVEVKFRDHFFQIKIRLL